jgi:hypothetical protein
MEYNTVGVIEIQVLIGDSIGEGRTAWNVTKSGKEIT